MWVFVVKLKLDRTLERYKSIVIAKGYNQIKGLDYTETLSPVIKPITTRVVLTLDLSMG